MPYVPVPVLGPAGGSHSPESLWPNRKRAREAQSTETDGERRGWHSQEGIATQEERERLHGGGGA